MARPMSNPNLKAHVLATIRAVRETNHACTAREMARLLGYSNSYVSRILTELKAEGLVTETRVPGSLVVVEDMPALELVAKAPAKSGPGKTHKMVYRDSTAVDCTCLRGVDHVFSEMGVALAPLTVPPAGDAVELPAPV